MRRDNSGDRMCCIRRYNVIILLKVSVETVYYYNLNPLLYSLNKIGIYFLSQSYVLDRSLLCFLDKVKSLFLYEVNFCSKIICLQFDLVALQLFCNNRENLYYLKI